MFLIPSIQFGQISGFGSPPRHGAPRPPRNRSRQLAVRRRRVGLAVAIGILGAASLIAIIFQPGSGIESATPAGSSAHRPATRAQGIAAIESGVLPWSLPQPVDHPVVLPGGGTTVTVAGGMGPGGPVASTYPLDTASGTANAGGNLAAGLAGAAGARLRGRAFVFGGFEGNPAAPVSDVESYPLNAPSVSNGAVIGHLPVARSGASAVVVGDRILLVGGSDGSRPVGEVIATRDGRAFNDVAVLPVAVRDAAAVAFRGQVYLFGGYVVGGANDGKPVNAVQQVDPGQRSARVITKLPQPLAAAAAAVVGSQVYIAGGTQGTAPSGSELAPGVPSSKVLAFDPSTRRVLAAGFLPQAIAGAGVQVVGNRAWLLGGNYNGTPTPSVEMITPNKKFGTAGEPGAGSPYFGDKLLVADRGNNRLLLLDDTGRILWTYPSADATAPPGGFYFPDDAFFARHGTEIISNQEDNETVVIIGFPSGKLLWSYGHPRQASTEPGYLNSPDDAYLLKNGQVVVADDDNCRILFITPNGSLVNQFGTTDSCVHQPPTSLGSPNGDTPLADGNILVSEIDGSWISEYTPTGSLVWTVQLPSVGYVSDPQQVAPDLYLVSDYSHPGGFVEFTREGRIVYRYEPQSGLGEMNQPSLTELLPSGVFMANDDYRNRMVAIDPATQAVVWQYGIPDQAGTAPGMLNIPDGFDLLTPNGSTPLHPTTG